MAQLRGTRRYRLVDLSAGCVVVVFQVLPGLSVLESCQLACEEFEIIPENGKYRMDRMYQNTKTKRFRWMKRCKITIRD